MAGLCLRRFVRLARCSDGAGLAGFVASAVTERTEGQGRFLVIKEYAVSGIAHAWWQFRPPYGVCVGRGTSCFAPSLSVPPA